MSSAIIRRKWCCLRNWSEELEQIKHRLNWWYVASPDQVKSGAFHIDAFSQGVRLDDTLRLTAKATPGDRTDYKLGGTGNVHYLSPRLAAVFREHAADDVQLIPVCIDGVDYFVMSVLSFVDCVDETASVLYREADWMPGDRGNYRMVEKLMIDVDAARGHNVLVPSTWPVVVVVSPAIADRIRTGFSGVVLEECSA